MILFLLVSCGLITGLLSGMLGIGGGVIIVPALYFLFQYTGAFEGHVMQVAASTSLAISFTISLCASFVQHSKRAILFSALKFVVPGLVVGCIFGVCLTQIIATQVIRFVFGIGALVLGLYFIMPQRSYLHIADSPNPSLSFVGLIMGTISSLIGIGGGVLAFPIFLGYGMSPKASSATSACTTTISTLVGTLTYFVIERGVQAKSMGTFGYIDIKAFFLIGSCALLTTPLGVRLSHSCDTYVIKKIFGFCLSLVGCFMVIL